MFSFTGKAADKVEDLKTRADINTCVVKIILEALKIIEQDIEDMSKTIKEHGDRLATLEEPNIE